MNSTNEQMLGCAVILTNSKGEVLLGKRKNAYKAGYYGLPGGRLEVGEPLLTCVAREVQEETSITGLSYTFVTTVREWQGHADFVHFIYATPLSHTEVKVVEPDKCEGWEWFSPQNLPELVLAGHRAGIEAWASTHGTIQDLPKPSTSHFLA